MLARTGELQRGGQRASRTRYSVVQGRDFGLSIERQSQQHITGLNMRLAYHQLAMHDAETTPANIQLPSRHAMDGRMGTPSCTVVTRRNK